VTLVLADIEGMSYEEIATAAGTNVGTIKSRLSAPGRNCAIF
jgi:DNA-directed RNA polymerase specialized sigma24 family protein